MYVSSGLIISYCRPDVKPNFKVFGEKMKDERKTIRLTGNIDSKATEKLEQSVAKDLQKDDREMSEIIKENTESEETK